MKNETKVLFLLKQAYEQKDPEGHSSLVDVFHAVCDGFGWDLPLGAFIEAENALWAAFAATNVTLWVPNPQAPASTSLHRNLLLSKISARAWKNWMAYEVVYAAYVACAMMDDSLSAADLMEEVLREEEVYVPVETIKSWLTVLDKIEYSSDGFVKRYPSEKDYDKVREELRGYSK